MDAGAFSNDEVVKASEGLVRILVDAERDPKLFEKYDVQPMPAVLYLDPDGKRVGEMSSKAAPALKAELEAIVKKHGREPRKE